MLLLLLELRRLGLRPACGGVCRPQDGLINKGWFDNGWSCDSRVEEQRIREHSPGIVSKVVADDGGLAMLLKTHRLMLIVKEREDKFVVPRCPDHDFVRLVESRPVGQPLCVLVEN